MISAIRVWLVAAGQWDSDGSWAYNPMLCVESAEIAGTLVALSVPAVKPVLGNLFSHMAEYTLNLDYRASIGIIHLAAGIQRLACACLPLMQQNFASTLSEIPVGSLSGAERAEKGRNPFSWIEEYRTY